MNARDVAALEELSALLQRVGPHMDELRRVNRYLSERHHDVSEVMARAQSLLTTAKTALEQGPALVAACSPDIQAVARRRLQGAQDALAQAAAAHVQVAVRCRDVRRAEVLRQVRLVRPQWDDAAVAAAVDGGMGVGIGSGLFLETQELSMGVAEVRQLTTAIAELRFMFRDVLVHAQHDTVVTIEADVDAAGGRVQHAGLHIRSTDRSADRARRRVCCVALLVAAVICGIGGLIAATST